MHIKLYTGIIIQALLLLLSLNARAQSVDNIARPDTLRITTDSLIKDTTVRKDSVSVQQRDSVKTSVADIKGYEIKGTVKDANTGEGIPFATVFFPGTGTGTPADLDGNFTLTFGTPPNDTLRIQAMGYATSNRRFDRSKKQVTIVIEMERSASMLKEVVIHGGADPALILLKKIIKHKPENNPDRVANYKYEVYNKLEVDLQRLSKKQFERLPVPMMKKFSFIYDNLDSTSEDKPFLPIYLTETLSDYYYQREPKKTKEFIKANSLKGFKNESITQFLGSMYQNVNAYDNYMPVFDKQFVSPISNAGAFYYKYKIKDTQQAYGHNIILVQFTPKRNGENCFYGDFWVVDSVYALQRISMEVPKDANVNWVNRVSLYQEFAPLKDTLWFPVKEKFIADFTGPYGAKLPSFIGRKTTLYQKINVNDTTVTAIVNDAKLKRDVMIADTATAATDAYWDTVRPDSLTKNEQAIYRMMDTLDKMPLFVKYKNTMKFLMMGLVNVGPFELGPYWYLYTGNPIEGSRFRISLGTNTKIFRDVYLNGYVAYGTKDQEYKYKASGLWILQREPKPRMYLFASYTHDLDRSTTSYDEVSNDNLFSTIARKGYIPWKLAMVNEARFEFFKSYYSGFSHHIQYLHKEFMPYDPLPYKGIFTDQDGNQTNGVINSEIDLKLRYAYKEAFLTGNYYRTSLGSKYPIPELRIGVGLKDLWNSNYSYQKVQFSVSDYVKIAPLGSLYYKLFAGKYFGTLPYPLLGILPGNDYYVYNSSAFNMMNRYEFIADEYAGFNIEHNIGGGVFNYIPLLKKLKLRQFWTAKGVIGSLSEDNQKLNMNKGYPFRTLDGDPYVEIGTGVENILQLFRIDFVWRVTPKPLPDESKEKYFGIFGSMKFNF